MRRHRSIERDFPHIVEIVVPGRGWGGPRDAMKIEAAAIPSTKIWQSVWVKLSASHVLREQSKLANRGSPKKIGT
jgi:hypothetical protein